MIAAKQVASTAFFLSCTLILAYSRLCTLNTRLSGFCFLSNLEELIRQQTYLFLKNQGSDFRTLQIRACHLLETRYLKRCVSYTNKNGCGGSNRRDIGMCFGEDIFNYLHMCHVSYLGSNLYSFSLCRLLNNKEEKHKILITKRL